MNIQPNSPPPSSYSYHEELSSLQPQNKTMPLSEAFNSRRPPRNTPVITKVVSPIIPIRTQEIDAEIALADEMQQRRRQTTASAPQTQSTTRAAARALRREKQASRQAEKKQREAALKKEALDKAWSDLSAFDGSETESEAFNSRRPPRNTPVITKVVSPIIPIRTQEIDAEKDHVEILFKKTIEDQTKKIKELINSLNINEIEKLVVEKLKNFQPSEIDFLYYAIEKLENNKGYINNSDDLFIEFFVTISPHYVNKYISDFHSDESVACRMRNLKTKIEDYYNFLEGYIKLRKNPSLLLKLIFMEECVQKYEKSSKRIADIFLSNLESLDSEKVISLNNEIKEEQKKYNNKLSVYSREIILIINRAVENIIDKTKITEKHATPETTSQSQKKRIQPKKIQPIRIETEPATVLEEDFSSNTPEDLADEVVRIFTKYTTGTRVVKSKDEAFLNYSVGKDDSLGELLKKPIFSLLNKIINKCLFVRSGHPCYDFMKKIKTAIEKIKKERRAEKAIIDQAHRVVACERAKAKKAQKEQAKKAQKEQAKKAQKEQAKIQKDKQKEHRKQDRIAAARSREQAKAEEAEKNKVIKMMSSWDWGQPKVEELPETQIITSDANELHSAIHCLISCGKALHAAREKLQAHVEYPKKLDLFRKFFWMLCSVTTWNDKKDELLSDVRHLSEEILSVMTVENLKTIASRVNSDGFYVINVSNIFKVSSPPNGVQNHEIWVDSKFVEEALQKIPQ